MKKENEHKKDFDNWNIKKKEINDRPIARFTMSVKSGGAHWASMWDLSRMAQARIMTVRCLSSKVSILRFSLGWH